MPIPTPFHPRTAELCTSYRWKEWAGYYAVCAYDTYHEREYFALRQGAGLIDVSPLFKYDIRGRDAASFLARVVTRDITRLKLGQVTYCCWCDDDGKVVDDGTIARLGEEHFRMTSALPTLYWLERYRRGYEIEIEDTSQTIAALSIQGPRSREILSRLTDADLSRLGFFKVVRCSVDGLDSHISRTGYTGDLGYEIWVAERDALKLWDALMSAGKPMGLMAAGLDAMDITRIEAGFILNGVDYYSAPRCFTDGRKSSPYEIGLGWTVSLDRDPFNGQQALRAEKAKGSAWSKVGLVLDWDELEAHFAEHGLPPEVCSHAWRTAVPVYDGSMRQVGYATSGSWSPALKKNLALATVRSEHAEIGGRLRMEVTVEYERRTVSAVVTQTPFLDLQRKRD